MSVWTRETIKKFAVVILVAIGIGFGLGRRRYQNRMPKDW